MPADLTPGPHGDALELANKAKFTVAELQAYEKARDEIRQVLEISNARWAEGLIEGETRGESRGETRAKIAAILAVLNARRIAASDDTRARIEACKDAAVLDRWIIRAATAASAESLFSEQG